MREIRTSGSMSGDGKRGRRRMAQATAPILDSTERAVLTSCSVRPHFELQRRLSAAPDAAEGRVRADEHRSGA
jgi:hypothetical protein